MSVLPIKNKQDFVIVCKVDGSLLRCTYFEKTIDPKGPSTHIIMGLRVTKAPVFGHLDP